MQNRVLNNARGREVRYRMNRLERQYGYPRSMNLYLRSQVNDELAKRMALARQKEKEMERKRLRLEGIKSKTVEKEKQKELDRQREKLRDKKMDKINAIGKYPLYEHFSDNFKIYNLRYIILTFYNIITVKNSF